MRLVKIVLKVIFSTVISFLLMTTVLFILGLITNFFSNYQHTTFNEIIDLGYAVFSILCGDIITIISMLLVGNFIYDKLDN